MKNLVVHDHPPYRMRTRRVGRESSFSQGSEEEVGQSSCIVIASMGSASFVVQDPIFFGAARSGLKTTACALDELSGKQFETFGKYCVVESPVSMR